MRKWFWIAPMFLLAACSRSHASQPTQPQAQAQAVQSASEAPAPATAQPGAAPAAETPAPPAAAPDPAPSAGVVIPRGTLLRVRVDEALSTRRNFRGDRFTAALTEPVIVDGENVLPSGTRLAGHVLISKPSGRLKGRALLELELDSFERYGHRYSITTTAAARVSGRHKTRNILAIGGGAGSGAIAGGAAITGKKPVTIPAESVIRFRLGERVRV